jgi:hypothetical protein
LVMVRSAILDRSSIGLNRKLYTVSDTVKDLRSTDAGSTLALYSTATAETRWPYV